METDKGNWTWWVNDTDYKGMALPDILDKHAKLHGEKQADGLSYDDEITYLAIQYDDEDPVEVNKEQLAGFNAGYKKEMEKEYDRLYERPKWHLYE